MGALIACLSVAAALIAILLAVLAAGRHYDRQHEAQSSEQAVLDEAERIVRSAEAQLRREARHRTRDDGSGGAD